MMDWPPGWTHVRLSEICTINPRVDKTALEAESVVSFVPMRAVEAGTGKIDISETRSFETVRKGYRPFRKGDVLFAKITPCMENGKMAVVPNLTSTYGFGSTEFHVLRSVEGVDPRFIYHAVSNRTFRFHAEHNMTGAVGQKRVPAIVLEEHEVGLPSTNEQRRIVERIEALFEEIDRGVESLRAAKSAISLYRKSLLKSAFEGRLTAEWRARNPDKLESPEALLARIRTEREVRYQAAIDDWKQAVADWTKNGKNGRKPAKPTKLGDSLDMTRRDMMEVPKGWALCKIRDVLEPVEKTRNDEQNREIWYVDISSIDNQSHRITAAKRLNLSEAPSRARQKIRFGDVLFSTVRPYLRKIAAVDKQFDGEIASTGFAVLRSVKGVDPRYLFYKSISHDFVSALTGEQYGVSYPAVKEEQVHAQPLELPPLNEQRRIVEILDARLEAADKLEAETDAALARADTLRQSILKKAFVGQLVPQDPADEPASALLDRIKAERAAQSKRPLRKPRKRKVAAA